MHVGVHYKTQVFKNSSTSFKNINGFLTWPFVQKKHAEGDEK
jgi:hypothetical protein